MANLPRPPKSEITKTLLKLLWHGGIVLVVFGLIIFSIAFVFLGGAWTARYRVHNEIKKHPGQLEAEATELFSMPQSTWEAKGWNQSYPKNLPPLLTRLKPAGIRLVSSRNPDPVSTAPYALKAELSGGFYHAGIYIPLSGTPDTWAFLSASKGREGQVGVESVTKLSDTVYFYTMSQ